jgi:hypothetical protein
MTGWEDHEKMAALVEVVKMCDSDTINYMAQCLMQRLVVLMISLNDFKLITSVGLFGSFQGNFICGSLSACSVPDTKE